MQPAQLLHSEPGFGLADARADQEQGCRRQHRTAASRAVNKWLRLTAPQQDSRFNLPLTTCSPLLIQLLIAAAAAAGLTVTHSDPRCAENPMLMGGWNREQAVVFLCAASIRAQEMDQEEILRHELIHVIQDLHQGALLPEPLFTILARETIPSGEVMMVIASGDDANRELECRLLTRMLSTPVVAQWLTESAAKNRQGVVIPVALAPKNP